MIQQSHSWGYNQRMQLRLLQRHLHTHVYCSTIHNSQVMETAKMPHYQRMDYENVVLIHNGVLLRHEEKLNLIILN
jgi:7,8-dihydro-6-hydroxymethylpterin-pyrophosphokinase